MQNSRADPIKDLLGVLEAFIDAFEIERKKIKGKKIKLILAGPIAGDAVSDALIEYKKILEKIEEFYKKFALDPNKEQYIYLLPLFAEVEGVDKYKEQFTKLGFDFAQLLPVLDQAQKQALVTVKK